MPHKPVGACCHGVSLVASGAVCALVVTIRALSFAALMWPPSLLSHGTLQLLFGTVLSQIVTSSVSGMPQIMTGASSAALPLCAMIARGVHAALQADFPGAENAQALHDAAIPTITVALGLSAMCIGVCFAVISRLRLSSAFQFLPYTVVQGFFAVVGVSLCVGALSAAATDDPSGDLTVDAVRSWVTASGAVRCVAVLLFGLLLRAAARFTRVGRHFLFFPVAVLLAGGGFFVLHAALQGSHPQWRLDALRSAGWLPSPQASAALPDLWLRGFALGNVHWKALVRNIEPMLAMALITAVDLAVGVPALAAASGAGGNLHREFGVAGLSNVLAGLTGCSPMYMTLTTSKLNSEVAVVPSRVPGFVAAALGTAALWWGTDIIQYTPNFIVHGILLYMGSGFLLDAAWDARRLLSRSEASIILGMLVAAVLLNTIAAVGVGLAAACALFSLRSAQYSRATSVVFVADAKEVLAHEEHFMLASGRCVPQALAPTHQGAASEDGAAAEEHSDVMAPGLSRLFDERKVVVIALRGYFYFGNAHLLAGYVDSLLALHDMPAGEFPRNLQYKPQRKAISSTQIHSAAAAGIVVPMPPSAASGRGGSMPRSKGSYSNLAGQSVALPPAADIPAIGKVAQHSTVGRLFPGLRHASSTPPRPGAAKRDERAQPLLHDAAPHHGASGSVNGFEMGSVAEQPSTAVAGLLKRPARGASTLGGLVVDLSRVDGLDASAASALLKVRSECAARSIHFVLVASPEPRVQKRLSALGVTHVSVRSPLLLSPPSTAQQQPGGFAGSGMSVRSASTGAVSTDSFSSSSSAFLSAPPRLACTPDTQHASVSVDSLLQALTYLGRPAKPQRISETQPLPPSSHS